MNVLNVFNRRPKMIAENITSTIGEMRGQQSSVLAGRAHRLLTRELSFVPNKAFAESKHGEACRGNQRVDLVEEQGNGPTVKLRPGLPAHLLRMCEASIMTPEEERAAFQRMNFLKYYYNHHRMLLDEDTAGEDHLDMMEDLIDRAERIRNDIISSSIRLVISIIKKYCTPHCVFDDLLSDGIVSLLRAVDKFDFDRGFRFSTYATHSSRFVESDCSRPEVSSTFQYGKQAFPRRPDGRGKFECR